MLNILFFSPLEQFEFTLITGKSFPNFSILDLLLPLEKNTYLNELLIAETPLRAATRAQLDFNIKFWAITERQILPLQFQDRYNEALTNAILENRLFSGENGKTWYRNLDFLYILEEVQDLMDLFYLVFEKLGNDDGHFFNWDICFLDQELETMGIFFETDMGYTTLSIDEKTYGIIAGYILTDLYVPHNPEGLNPTLTFLTKCYTNWIADRILLNESFTVSEIDASITTADNNAGLTALEMNKRDETHLVFFWLNIYNSLFMVITLIILIFIIFNQGYAKVQNIWQVLNNLTFDFLVKSFISLANKNLLSFFPIFFCFFIFIYLLNLTALTPLSFCLTSNLWFSLSLSFSVWFGVTALAIIVRGHEFFLGFVPKNIASNELKVFITIIEVISYVARSLSLGVRIFANMLAGHSLVHILSDLTATCFVEFDNIGLKIFGIFPAIILSFILIIEFGICFLQGLVFVILTAIYLKEAFQGH